MPSLFIRILALTLLAAALAQAQTLPAGFSQTSLASNIANPTAMAFAPDGRIFICQQSGELRVFKNGGLLSTAFLTVSVDPNGERGLLGVAFDPDFSVNQFVYIYYTVPSTPRRNRVSRWTANGDTAVAGSEVIILELDDLSSATNHNGGAIAFGPDGKLYVAVGDNANSANAQTLSNRHGKILRINSDGTIPSDNPFFGTASGANRAIWALGLRNPFSFTFQPATGVMLINDVGQVTREEINLGVAGANYGWPTCEGPCSPANPNFRDPIYYYTHMASSTQGCAITSGAFYNPPVGQFPSLYLGKYFFLDFCSNWINYIDPSSPPAVNSATVFATGLISSPVAILTGPDGSLYYLSRGSTGRLLRISFTNGQSPVVTDHPQSIEVPLGQSATFNVMASGTTPFAYQWQRNGIDIPGANMSSYTIASAGPADNGARFRCRVSNSFGSATSDEAVLTVATDQPPTGQITMPAMGALYRGGETINFAGTATDPEDGNLPASAFTWEVVFHHDTHTHPFLPPVSGVASGSFVIPTEGETSANVWYRIHLTVRDSDGRTHASFRDVLPRTAMITIATIPSGLTATIDGQPATAPFSVQGVAGILRAIGVDTLQALTGRTYRFNGWSDGGGSTHTISTPESDTVYTASFVCRSGCPTGTIKASPDPIRVCDGSGLGATRLSYNTSGVTAVQIRIGSPGGALVYSGGPSGMFATGKWVRDGMEFYLQNVSGGLPLTAENTLASVRVEVTANGCRPR